MITAVNIGLTDTWGGYSVHPKVVPCQAEHDDNIELPFEACYFRKTPLIFFIQHFINRNLEELF